MLIEVEAVLPAKPNLEQIVIETLLADADLGGGILEGVPFGGFGRPLLDSGVVLPPLDHLIDDVAYPPLLRPATFVRFVVLPFLVFPLLHHRLVDFLRHEFVDERDVHLFGSDGELVEFQVVLRGDGHVLVDWVVPAVHVDIALRQVVKDLVVWVSRTWYSRSGSCSAASACPVTCAARSRAGRSGYSTGPRSEPATLCCGSCCRSPPRCPCAESLKTVTSF